MILLVGNFGKNNLGDDLLIYAFCIAIPKIYKNKFKILVEEPLEAEAWWQAGIGTVNIEKYNKYNFKKVIYCGGNQIFEFRRNVFLNKLANKFKQFLKLDFRLNKTKRLKININDQYHFGIGIGPFFSYDLAKREIHKLKQAKYISVRDFASSKLLEENNIEHDIAPDMVFGIAKYVRTFADQNVNQKYDVYILRNFPHNKLQEKMLLKKLKNRLLKMIG